MKKTLFLIRHAAARETERGGKDFNRILMPEGARNASRLGRQFFKDNKSIDLILASSATRAADTALLIAEQMMYDPSRIQFPEFLYEASVREMLKLVNELTDDLKNVVVVGHNPTISYFAEYITNAVIDPITPAGMVTISFECPWELVSQGTGNLEGQTGPLDLEEM